MTEKIWLDERRFLAQIILGKKCRTTDKEGFYLGMMAGRPYLFFGESGQERLVRRAVYFDGSTHTNISPTEIGALASNSDKMGGK